MSNYPKELHVRDLRSGAAVLDGTKLILRGPFVERPRAAASPTATASRGTSPTAPPSAPRAGYTPAQQHQRDANGKVGEAVAEMLHDICRREGVADVQKVPSSLANRGRDPCDPRFFRGTYTHTVGVDYRGLLIGDGSGRGVYAEAKHVAADDGRYYLRALREDQRAQLDLAVRAGAVGVLVIVHGTTRQRVFAINWAAVQKLEAAGARAIGLAELAGWLVPTGTAYLAHYLRRRIGR